MANLTVTQQELIEMAVDYGALKFGEFTLKSGRLSPYFFNLGDLSRGGCLHILREAYGEAIYEQFGSDFDVLFGPAYKGIPLAVITADYLYEAYSINVRYCANRKEAKDHGESGKLLGGPIRDNDRVVIIEDVMTSGKSINEVLPLILEQGENITVAGEIIALDRRERADGTDQFALDVISRVYGFPVKSIFTIDDVADYLRAREIITPAAYQKVQDYLAKYGGVTA